MLACIIGGGIGNVSTYINDTTSAILGVFLNAEARACAKLHESIKINIDRIYNYKCMVASITIQLGNIISISCPVQKFDFSATG